MCDHCGCENKEKSLSEKVEELIQAIRPNLHREVAVVFADVDDALPRARAAVEALGMHVASYDFTHDVASGELRITFDVKFRRHGLGEKLLASFRDLPGVRSVAWLPPES